jgi:hypothetical protein
MGFNFGGNKTISLFGAENNLFSSPPGLFKN